MQNYLCIKSCAFPIMTTTDLKQTPISKKINSNGLLGKWFLVSIIVCLWSFRVLCGQTLIISGFQPHSFRQAKAIPLPGLCKAQHSH